MVEAHVVSFVPVCHVRFCARLSPPQNREPAECLVHRQVSLRKEL